MSKISAWLTNVKCLTGGYSKTDNPLLDICMVKYMSEKYEKTALKTLRQTTNVPYRLTEIDNSTANRSLTVIWNEFARQSTAPYICFVNPDVVFAPSWASNLMQAFQTKDIVIASPSTPTMSGSPIQRVEVGYKGSLAKLVERQEPEILDDPYIVGYCYCINRLWLQSVDYFDENTFPFYGQETDINFRAFDAGCRAVCVRNSIVRHVGRGSQEGAHRQKLDEDLQACFLHLQQRWPNWEHQS